MMRFVKIVCTIGPATSSVRAIETLITQGMDVARLNFSHGTHAEHLNRIKAIRTASKRVGKEVAILQDLPGPKIRVGRIADEPVILSKGTTVTLTTRPVPGSKEEIMVTYPDFPQAVEPDTLVYLADGAIRLRVVEVDSADVRCRVEIGGNISSGKGVNIPGASPKISAVTQEDLDHMSFGVKNNVDFIAVSFVRSAEDITYARKAVQDMGGEAQIVAKIEKAEAVSSSMQIIEKADCVMIARGDLGVELGVEHVPMVQKRIISEANRQGKPVITATQILISMLNDPTPTRAEVSDIANAILDGTDALMLSEETAVGKYYAQAVSVVARVAQTVEKELVYSPRAIVSAESVEDAVGTVACSLAHAVGAKFLLAYTRSGSTARLIAKYRPRLPINALTPNKTVLRQLRLINGVQPYYNPRNIGGVTAETVENQIKDLGVARRGDVFVLVAGSPTGPVGSTNMLRVQKVS